MKLLKILCLIIFLSIFSSLEVSARPEIWLKVLNPDGSFLSTEINIYRKSYVGTGYVLFNTGTSSSTELDNGANAIGDMVGSTDTDNTTWDALSFSSIYLFKIENSYCEIVIDTNRPSGPDLVFKYQNGVFSEISHHIVIRVGDSGPWNPKTLTVKNNFSNGKLTIDETYYPSVSSYRFLW
ncbi:MAG: hypothetical protein F9K42_08045 [Ignavibacterium sp.]|nr:MAG: hypothetical protein F9K42_08045 [Ignavibacterium sp.]